MWYHLEGDFDDDGDDDNDGHFDSRPEPSDGRRVAGQTTTPTAARTRGGRDDDNDSVEDAQDACPLEVHGRRLPRRMRTPTGDNADDADDDDDGVSRCPGLMPDERLGVDLEPTTDYDSDGCSNEGERVRTRTTTMMSATTPSRLPASDRTGCLSLGDIGPRLGQLLRRLNLSAYDNSVRGEPHERLYIDKLRGQVRPVRTVLHSGRALLQMSGSETYPSRRPSTQWWATSQ